MSLAHLTLATRNVRHFADLTVPVVDPWASIEQSRRGNDKA